MPLLRQFDESLLGRMATPALDFLPPDSGGVRRLTFGDLEQSSNRLAALLRARGLKPGDRLAFFCRTDPKSSTSGSPPRRPA